MGILNRDEIARRIKKGQLILNPRKGPDGAIDLQPASYDLTAGRAVWKEVTSKGIAVREMDYRPSSHPSIRQPYVVLQPGQMMSVITHEEILMPVELCGTVYSKNSLALNGIFAFNAGHVDPGFRGPIVIRVINLRATPWTFTLGERIFTIVFQTLDHREGDRLTARGEISQERTLQRVRHFTDIALSNALFDLYAQKINERLEHHRIDTLAYLTESLRKDFIPRDKLGAELWAWTKRNTLSILGFFGAIAGVVKGLDILREWLAGP